MHQALAFFAEGALGSPRLSVETKHVFKIPFRTHFSLSVSLGQGKLCMKSEHPIFERSPGLLPGRSHDENHARHLSGLPHAGALCCSAVLPVLGNRPSCVCSGSEGQRCLLFSELVGRRSSVSLIMIGSVIFSSSLLFIGASLL